MKTIFTTCLLVLSISIFAQEAGRSGELLKNEASQKEMQSERRDVSTEKTGVLDNSNNRISNNNRIPNSNRVNSSREISYKWNQNFGNSEVFLRIPEYGYFEVQIGDQMMRTNSGKFRFFDLRSGQIPIFIYEDGYLIYRARITVQNNRRLVLDFFTTKGLYLLDSYPVKNKNYGFSEWDDVWNNPYGNNFNQNGYGNMMGTNEFKNFINTLKKSTSFDNNKIDIVQLQLKNTAFTSEQIRIILETLSFDKNKLVIAKMAYATCLDKQNFYTVYEAFDFDSSRKELMKYISNGR